MKTKKGLLVGFVLLVISIFSGCGLQKADQEKIRDLEYTVLEEEEIPSELKEQIGSQKEGEFKLTYLEDGYLYIARGFGMQETGGYSMTVQEVYLTSNAIYFSAELSGPQKDEKIKQAVSYPYLVIKTEGLEEPVVFE